MDQRPGGIQQPVARLAISDGTVFYGTGFGYTVPRSIDGEVCFNTSLTGYQEILTDPSYAGQIVTLTNPQIGNYGVNPTDLESQAVVVGGLVIRELSGMASNHRATGRLETWLADERVLGICGIDTRALTRKLRVQGAMNGVLSTEPVSDDQLVDRARQSPGLVGRNLIGQVSIDKPMSWNEDLGCWAPPLAGEVTGGARRHVVAIDCGAKRNILRNLVQSGCATTLVPYDTPAGQILNRKPDGVFVSNGPGDPAAVTVTIRTLQDLVGRVPIFGICLGHQLLALALGATTYKLKFGHRGGNQPVQNLHTQKVEITSQNHGFAVRTESLESVGGEPTHINLNDRTLEGFRHRSEPLFAVQYHPEASPGPHDASYLFDCFIQMMDSGHSPTGHEMDEAQRRRNRTGVT